MNISSSIAEINFNTGQSEKIKSAKVYLWPEYNAGKVNSIPVVHEKTENNFNYIKRSLNDPAEEYTEVKRSANISYTSKGNLTSIPSNYTPGSIFEAMA